MGVASSCLSEATGTLAEKYSMKYVGLIYEIHTPLVSAARTLINQTIYLSGMLICQEIKCDLARGSKTSLSKHKSKDSQ